MKHPFKLSKSNIIYFIVVSILAIIFQTIIVKANSDEYIGYIIGTVIGCMLFPLLIALVFWLILGRKKGGGTTTFNIVLTLLLFGQCSNFVNTTQEMKSLKDLNTTVTDFKENIKTQPDSVETNYKQFSRNVRQNIKDLIASTLGKEKQLYIVLNDFFQESDSIHINWSESYSNLMAPRILDISILNDIKECDYQINIINDYISKSVAFKDFFENRVSSLTKKSGVLGEENKYVSRLIEGMKKKDSLQQPIFMPYINSHIEYGGNLIKMLNLLKKNKGKWRAQDEEVLFEDAESQDLYELTLSKAIENETKVSKLYDELIKVM